MDGLLDYLDLSRESEETVKAYLSRATQLKTEIWARAESQTLNPGLFVVQTISGTWCQVP